MFGLKAAPVEVTAMNFFSDENSGQSILSGNVFIKKEGDVLNSDKVVIYTDKNKKPIRYEATQNARFEVRLKDKSYKGSGDKFIYYVNSDIYEIIGNAYIIELETKRKIFGDKIIVDKKQKIYKVESFNKKPIRFVFDVEEK
ncbi:lipopolysaccharide transport periplasmic protein LptA [Campylobacter jejuni]|nr:lipopolysaccharide transport periplasmic protein LptA [Campylobacter jejuni]